MSTIVPVSLPNNRPRFSPEETCVNDTNYTLEPQDRSPVYGTVGARARLLTLSTPEGVVRVTSSRPTTYTRFVWCLRFPTLLSWASSRKESGSIRNTGSFLSKSNFELL